ncbi:MAG TPA: DUF3526 domain-containing protein, partial [Cyclobacteriaceae bacterium]|nr:DUF3526 domain-containing protein [Cyclobacteriaceae bacterium]
VEVIQAAVEPVVSVYDEALEEQQQWVSQWRVLSPAVLLQNSFNELAGTSTAHYQAFRKQVVTFSEAWRSFFIPRMFRNESMKPEALKSLPQHTYTVTDVSTHFITDFIGMLVFVAIALSGSLLVHRRFVDTGLTTA